MGSGFYFIMAHEGTVPFMITGLLDDVTRDCFYGCCVRALGSALNFHTNPLPLSFPFGEEGGNRGSERGSDLFNVTQ